jgi:Fic family protein
LVEDAVNRPNIHRMERGEYTYIWQADDWPSWRYDLAVLARPMTAVSLAQGQLLGRLADVGMGLRSQASLGALVQDAITTSEIEGERLDVRSVRSSLARRLGLEQGGMPPTDRAVEGVVEMVLDATANCEAPLTRERLFGWHAALFPTGFSGLHRIRVGGWRQDAEGPMQVVSGALGRQRVHFQAPPAERLEAEMERLLRWAGTEDAVPPLLKAGLGHLWLVILHPFEDGNGRIARAAGDLLLARAERSPQRFYSLSAEILRERKAYYDILERTQRGTGEVTAWLAWFLEALGRAVAAAQAILDGVLARHAFWQRFQGAALNARQVRILDLLLDDFEGRLTSGKYARIAGCSQDTALRDLSDLLARGALCRSKAGGRSTAYELAPPPAPAPDPPRG